MKKISLFLLFLAIGLGETVSGQTATKQKLAIYVGGNGDNAVKKVVGSKLTAAITSNSNYIAVERTSEFLIQLRDELFYQRTGNVDDKQIADFGKQMGVQAVCIAEVTGDVFGTTFVSARILDVTTGLVTATAEAYAVLNDMPKTVSFSEKLATDLCNTIGYELGDCNRLAVYVGGDGSEAVKKVIGSKLVSSIIGNGYYSAVERTNAFLAELGKEYNYQQTRNVNDNELTQLGKQFGVKVVCAAEITVGFGSYFVSVRLIDVTTGQILYTAESDNAVINMDALSSLANNVSYKLMKQIVTCTKEGKKIRYCETCCSGMKIDGKCLNPFSVIEKNYGLKIKIRAGVSWNDRTNSSPGYRLATKKELDSMIDLLKYIVPVDNKVYKGILSNDSYIDKDEIHKNNGREFNWSIHCTNGYPLEHNNGNYIASDIYGCRNNKLYSSKSSAEQNGSRDCKNERVFICVDVKQ